YVYKDSKALRPRPFMESAREVMIEAGAPARVTSSCVAARNGLITRDRLAEWGDVHEDFPIPSGTSSARVYGDGAASRTADSDAARSSTSFLRLRELGLVLSAGRAPMKSATGVALIAPSASSSSTKTVSHEESCVRFRLVTMTRCWNSLSSFT